MYVLNRAKVMTPGTSKDPRLTVRILGLMDDITDPMVLPKYPSFFKNQRPNFPIDTIVWVLSTDDFYLGYVLGSANIFSEDITKFNPPGTKTIEDVFKTVNDLTSKCGAGFFNSDKMNFLYVDNNIIEAIDYETGTKLTYHSSGNILIQSERGFFMKMGKSLFSLNEYQINLKADIINMAGEITLGKKGGSRYIVGSPTKNAVFKMADGAVLMTSGDVLI